MFMANQEAWPLGLNKILLNCSDFGLSMKRMLNWGTLNMPRAELQNLDELFTEEELKAVVFGMLGEKAPGPDGFTACFFKTCWTIYQR
jgi:hypothetical protein